MRFPSRLPVLAVVIALVMGLSLAALAQEPEGFGIRLLEVPADRADDPRANSYVIDHVSPATTIERAFEVINGDNLPASVQMYAAEARLEGDAFVPASGRQQNDLASWITVDPAEIDMQPFGRVQASLRIDVPPDAPEGEHYAVVLAERAAPDEVPAGEVGVAARVGIRVYLSVGPGGEPPTDFQITEFTALTREDGVRVVRSEVTNTGGRALDFAGELDLSDGPGGLNAGPYEVTPGTTLAPGGVVEMDVVLDSEIPGGPWQATLLLTSGRLERRATAELLFPDEPGTAADPQPVIGVQDEGGPLWVLLLIAAALLVALVIFVWMRRRGERPKDTDAVPPPPPGAAPRPVPAAGTGTWAPPSTGDRPRDPMGPPLAPPPAATKPRKAPPAPPPPPST